MSTILNALRRLEVDEQRKSQNQSLHDAEIRPAAPRGWRSVQLWLLGGAAILVGAGVGMVLRAWLAEDPVPAAELARAAPPRVASAVAELGGSPRVANRPDRSVPSAGNMDPVASARVMPQPPKIRVASAASAPPADVSTPPDTNGGGGAAVVAGAPAPVRSPSIPVTALPMRRAEKPARPPRLGSPPVADGPLIVVSELPVVVPPPAPPPGPAPVEAAPRAVASKSKLVSPPPAEATPTASLEHPSAAKASSVPPKKLAPVAEKEDAARPIDTPASPKQVAESPSAFPPPPLLDAKVLRTVWHPNAARRVAYLSADGSPSDLAFEEGDLWRGWRLVEIKLSGVAFERGGVRRYLRVGQGQ